MQLSQSIQYLDTLRFYFKGPSRLNETYPDDLQWVIRSMFNAIGTPSAPNTIAFERRECTSIWSILVGISSSLPKESVPYLNNQYLQSLLVSFESSRLTLISNHIVHTIQEKSIPEHGSDDKDDDIIYFNIFQANEIINYTFNAEKLLLAYTRIKATIDTLDNLTPLPQSFDTDHIIGFYFDGTSFTLSEATAWLAFLDGIISLSLAEKDMLTEYGNVRLSYWESGSILQVFTAVPKEVWVTIAEFLKRGLNVEGTKVRIMEQETKTLGATMQWIASSYELEQANKLTHEDGEAIRQKFYRIQDIPLPHVNVFLRLDEEIFEVEAPAPSLPARAPRALLSNPPAELPALGPGDTALSKDSSQRT